MEGEGLNGRFGSVPGASAAAPNNPTHAHCCPVRPPPNPGGCWPQPCNTRPPSPSPCIPPASAAGPAAALAAHLAAALQVRPWPWLAPQPSHELPPPLLPPPLALLHWLPLLPPLPAPAAAAPPLPCTAAKPGGCCAAAGRRWGGQGGRRQLDKAATSRWLAD